jgi:primosomal protein DnaI
MSDLSRLKLSPEGPAASDSEKNRLFQELLQDPSVLRLLKTHAIPEQLLWDNLYTFSRWQKEVEPCRGCKSLSQCRQKKKGYHMGLSYEGLLVETLEACKYEREKESALSHLKQYLVSDLGSEFEQCFFDRIDYEQESNAYVRSAREAYQCYLDGKGAYLYGNMGTGKTYLAACASNEMARDGKKPVFVHYPSYCDRLARMYHTGEYRKEAEMCRFTDFLVIDDIGAEEVTARNRMVLLSLLDDRMKNQKMTWFTGNGDFEMLRNHLRYDAAGEDVAAADRILERIRILAKPILVEGNDRRVAAEDK